VSDRADPPPRNAPDPADAPEQARGLGGLLARHAVDTRPLAVAAYRRLLIGQSTSFVGSMLTQVAVPVQVWGLTHSTLDVGYVGLAGLLPIVVFGLYGGAIADAIDRRTLYLWSSTGGWVVTLAPLVQTLLDLRDVRLILPGRRPVRDVRHRLLGPGRDHPAHRADRSRPGRQHP